MAVAEKEEFLLSSGYAFYIPIGIAIFQSICRAFYKVRGKMSCLIDDNN